MPASNQTGASGQKNLKTSTIRTGGTHEELKQSFIDSMICAVGKNRLTATLNDVYTAVSLAIRDRLMQQCNLGINDFVEKQGNVVAYLSAEYLPGPHLKNNMINLGLLEASRKAIKKLGWDMEEIFEQEEEPGLGNGGLGRLASCYMDSMATQQIASIGYGIRYEFGIFDQIIKDGWQLEITDKWLKNGNPWEIARPEISYEVFFGGRVETVVGEPRWVPGNRVKGVAYDTPISGYQVDHCNTLRLWKSEASVSFDLQAFNKGEYYKAVEEKLISENITKVLYPNDQIEQGKILRLQQQFFFVSCSIQDMIRIHLNLGYDLLDFHKKWCIQLNDTHPAISVAELMRLLVDVHKLDWNMAWHITQYSCSFTNHTLLPEALEKWPVELFEKLLPRHLEIIYMINHFFLEGLRKKFPSNDFKIGSMSLIDESGERYVRMANLAAVGSHRINGVSEIHSSLLRKTVMKDFYELWPNKFCNVTNGVTQRRFLLSSNELLADLITKKIGPTWTKDLHKIESLESLANDSDFKRKWKKVKLQNKERLSSIIKKRTGILVDSKSLFDIQVKRIHEYKRQHLNAMYIIYLYQLMKEKKSDFKVAPRTFIFGGKAAPGYFMAKLIIKLINSLADVVNNDNSINGALKVVFFPDFNVKNAEYIYPAADLSEQISMAGKEASGTGNMKFAMNGALTIGTLDGANIEIREEVGEENFFAFGSDVLEVAQIKANGYDPSSLYHESHIIQKVIDFILSTELSNDNPGLFKPLVENLIYHDPYLVLADFDSYIKCQDRVNELWMNQSEWTSKSILNVARIGKFSSDRSIIEYFDQIWTKRSISPAEMEYSESALEDY